EQEYLLVFGDEELLIFHDKFLVSTLESPWRAQDLRLIRFTQTADALIVVHFAHPPMILERLGSHTDWALSVIEHDPMPYHQYAAGQTLKPSATTGNITLTLSPADPYWS